MHVTRCVVICELIHTLLSAYNVQNRFIRIFSCILNWMPTLVPVFYLVKSADKYGNCLCSAFFSVISVLLAWSVSWETLSSVVAMNWSVDGSTVQWHLFMLPSCYYWLLVVLNVLYCFVLLWRMNGCLDILREYFSPVWHVNCQRQMFGMAAQYMWQLLEMRAKLFRLS